MPKGKPITRLPYYGPPTQAEYAARKISVLVNAVGELAKLHVGTIDDTLTPEFMAYLLANTRQRISRLKAGGVDVVEAAGDPQQEGSKR